MALRLFVGLPLPDAYQELLAELQREWRTRLRSRLNWTKPGNWHVTLKFLGDTQETLLEELTAALAGVHFAPFTLQAGGGGFFPPPKPPQPLRPRVAWAGLRQGAQEATALAAAVEAALVPVGFEPESRPFRPHLTLARVKQAAREDATAAGGKGAPAGWPGLLAALQATDWPECTMERFTLWQSRLGPNGPSYSPLAEVPARG